MTTCAQLSQAGQFACYNSAGNTCSIKVFEYASPDLVLQGSPSLRASAYSASANDQAQTDTWQAVGKRFVANTDGIVASYKEIHDACATSDFVPNSAYGSIPRAFVGSICLASGYGSNAAFAIPHLPVQWSDRTWDLIFGKNSSFSHSDSLSRPEAAVDMVFLALATFGVFKMTRGILKAKAPLSVKENLPPSGQILPRPPLGSAGNAGAVPVGMTVPAVAEQALVKAAGQVLAPVAGLAMSAAGGGGGPPASKPQGEPLYVIRDEAGNLVWPKDGQGVPFDKVGAKLRELHSTHGHLYFEQVSGTPPPRRGPAPRRPMKK